MPNLFNTLFNFIAIPLGYILWFVYRFVGNYFAAIFLFTLVVRAATFPLSLKSQRSQADRAKLAPRLERLQKKYAQDKKKLQTKQMELYEKEGVSLTGGCLPIMVQMVVLFGVISVIYSPLTHLARIPTAVINTSVAAVTQTAIKDDMTEEEKAVAADYNINKVADKELKGYYKEMRMLEVLEVNKDNVINAMNANSDQLAGKTAQEYYDSMIYIRNDFTMFGYTLLKNPWTEKGLAGINIIWLIPLLSGLTAFGSSAISMRYTKLTTPTAEGQPGQGCSNNMMLIMMPMFSLYITFVVPGGVGIYWICSNIIAMAQTVLLNKIYNPVTIRAQAEAEYEERRRQKAEDKKRLAEARVREEEESRRLEKEAKSAGKTSEDASVSKKKAPPVSKNPNKLRKRESLENQQVETEEEEYEIDTNDNSEDNSSEN